MRWSRCFDDGDKESKTRVMFDIEQDMCNAVESEDGSRHTTRNGWTCRDRESGVYDAWDA